MFSAPGLVRVLPPRRRDARERAGGCRAPACRCRGPAEKCSPAPARTMTFTASSLDGAGERVVERVGHLRVLRVAVLRAVHRHDRRRVARFVEDDVARSSLVAVSLMPRPRAARSVASASRTMRSISSATVGSSSITPTALPRRQDAHLGPPVDQRRAREHRRVRRHRHLAPGELLALASSRALRAAGSTIDVAGERAERPGVPERAERAARTRRSARGASTSVVRMTRCG